MTYEETARGYAAKIHFKAFEMALGMYKRNGKLPSYQEIADMCGISKGTIVNIMKRHRTVYNPETAQKIEEGLRVDPQSIFTLIPLRVDTTRNASHAKAAA